MVFSQLPPLADGAVLLSGLGAGGSGYRLDRGSQGAEEASNKGEAETTPGAEHGPAVAVADVVRQAVQVTWVTRKLKIDASNAGTEGNDAEGSCNEEHMMLKEKEPQSTPHSERKNIPCMCDNPDIYWWKRGTELNSCYQHWYR